MDNWCVLVVTFESYETHQPRLIKLFMTPFNCTADLPPGIGIHGKLPL